MFFLPQEGAPDQANWIRRQWTDNIDSKVRFLPLPLTRQPPGPTKTDLDEGASGFWVNWLGFKPFASGQPHPSLGSPPRPTV